MCAKCTVSIKYVFAAKTVKCASGWEVAVQRGDTVMYLDSRFVLRYVTERAYTNTVFGTRAEARRHIRAYNEVQSLQSKHCSCQIQLKGGLH